MVQGPAAQMCRLSVSSWGAEVRVKGWHSLIPRARQAIRTHCPDLYSKPWGRWNSRWVTPEEGRWVGGCCPEPSNNVTPREFPNLQPQLCFWNMTEEASRDQRSLLPSGHVYPERMLGSTGAGGQQDKEQPGLGSSSVVREAQVPWQRASLTSSLIPTTSRTLLTPLGQARRFQGPGSAPGLSASSVPPACSPDSLYVGT